MWLVIIPGNSPIHKEWSEKVKEKLGHLFDDTKILSYSHWGTEKLILDFDLELEKLIKLTSGLSDYIIFAKSAGTILAMRGINEKKLSPKKCIFLGVPILWAKQNNFPIEEWITSFSTPTHIIQQEFDRTCPVEDLQKSFKELNIVHYTIQVIPGNDHDYSDWEELTKETSNFVIQQP